MSVPVYECFCEDCFSQLNAWAETDECGLLGKKGALVIIVEPCPKCICEAIDQAKGNQEGEEECLH
jgi:uncharacterized protein YcbX